MSALRSSEPGGPSSRYASLGYYVGRTLQVAGLVIMAETLIVYFGEMMPLLKGSLLGVTVFYLGTIFVTKYGRRPAPRGQTRG